MKRNELLSKLREMNSPQIAEFFHMPSKKAGDLKTAIAPKRYIDLTDHNKTAKEIAEKLGYKETTVNSHRYLLIKYDLDNRKTSDVKNSLIKFLRKPRSKQEIKEKGFNTDAVYRYGEITSVGPKNRRLYYLKGQKKTAENELERRIDERDELVLNVLTEPMSVNELCRRAKTNYNHILILESEGKLLRARNVYSSKKSGEKGKEVWLLKKDHLYKPGQEQDVADIIIQRIHSMGNLSQAEKSSLTWYARKLPKPIFEIVHKSYTFHSESEGPKDKSSMLLQGIDENY